MDRGFESLGPDWAALKTADGSFTLAHHEHAEWYHSSDGAMTEARALYVESSGFAGSLQASTTVRVLDVGLGLGYNALATIDEWFRSGGVANLEVLSLENDEALFSSLRSGRAPWMNGWPPGWLEVLSRLELAPDGSWQARLVGPQGGALFWKVAVGDARSAPSLAAMASSGPFDFVWQDPFSPAKNPSMWGEGWFAEVAGAVRRDGVLMTYSVARPVREALLGAGWRVEKIPTTTRKKNWLRAFRLAPAGEPT